MNRIARLTTILVAVTIWTSSLLMASGSGHHAHEHGSSTAENNGTVTYQDTQHGIAAYLELENAGLDKTSAARGFVVVCNATAYLQDAATGKPLKVAGMALRATVDHGEFGEAKALLPAGDGRMGTTLYITEKGEQHYLLIAEIPGVGSKEFHFHHVF